MRAAQPLSGDFMQNKYFGKRTIRPCASSAKGDNIVLIEVDTDDFGDVIILDVPESLPEKFKKNREHHVISIDDDDDDDDEHRTGKCHMADGATSNNSFSSASDTHPSHRANVSESGPFVGEGSNPVKLSNSRQTHSGQGIPRNRYGLDSDFEACSSESDDSDCELVEDSLGKLREEWEKASFRRRHEASVQSDTEDKASPPASNFTDHNSAEEGTADHLKPTNYPSKLSSLNQGGDSQKFAEGNDCSQKDSDTEEIGGLFTRKCGRYHESSDTDEKAPASNSPDHDSAEEGTADHLKPTNSPSNLSSLNPGGDSQKFAEGNDCSQKDSDTEEIGGLFTRKCGRYHESSDMEDEASPPASNFPDHNSAEEGTVDCLKPTNSPSNLSSLNQGGDSQKFAEGSDCSQKDSDTEEIGGLFTRKRGRYHESSDTENNVNTCESDQPFQDTTGPNTPEHSEHPEDNCCFKSSPVNHERNEISSDIPERVAESSKRSVHVSGAEVAAKTSTGNLSDEVTSRITNEGVENENFAFNDGEQYAEGHAIALNNSSDSQLTELKSSSDHNDMIMDRQKLKETDEYRHAMEEEWASRQQQLQRQAEEARRLRNRKRAETMRIMANERRQRLRLEEVRETRRKDEENSNLKDKLRAEIKNELRKLEITCSDMASLLRALGIHVGGGFRPSPNEVQVAYKKACLKFHPDRLSGRDLRQQVEAEEKFKLISNMKDKFSLGR